MKQLISGLFLLTIICSGNAQVNPALIDSLGKITLEKTNTTGAYISIINKNAVIYSSSFGYNNRKTKSSINDSTVFPISSNTKAFNSILLSQLVQKDSLSFDEPLKTYLPDLKFKNNFITSELTLIDLLTHRFGFPRYDFTYYLLSDEEKINPNEAVFKKLQFLETTSSFRTRFQYGNNQYILAAYLLERIKNDKWENILLNNILKPLGMSNTHCDLDQFILDKNKSIGYQDKKAIDINYIAPMYSVSGMGNIFSTIKDLEKWCIFLNNANDSVLSKELIEYNLSGHFSVGYEEPFPGFSSIQYGLGWYIFDYYGHKVVLHHGDNIGHQSLIVLLPDDNISWVIMANEGMSSNSFPFRMAFSLLDIIVKNKLNDWNQLLERENAVYYRYPDSLKTKNAPPKLSLSEYEGVYFHEGFGKIKVYLKDKKLYFSAGAYKDSLQHWEFDSFRACAAEFKEDYIFKFIVNAQNKVIGLESDLIEPQIGLIKFKKRL